MVAAVGMIVLSACTAGGNPTVSPTLSASSTATAQPARPTQAATFTEPVPFAWISEVSLLFQAGDLPGDVKAGEFDSSIPSTLKDKYGTALDGAMALQLLDARGQAGYGNVSLYLYKNPAVLNDVASHLIQAEQALRVGVAQPGIGVQAFLYLPEQAGSDMALLFSTCRTVVTIRLSKADQAAILRYASRLAERLNQVDCQGKLDVPIQTAPAPLPTATPTSATADVLYPILVPQGL